MTAKDRLLDRVVEWFAVHGVGDTSLRTIATGVDSSHRMLLHHFGSRQGLLRAVSERVEAAQQQRLEQLAVSSLDPREAAWAFWQDTVRQTGRYGPLVFELLAHAMLGAEYAQGLRAALIDDWLDPLAGLWMAGGLSADEARDRARLDLAVARGLLQDLLLTGDHAGVDAAMARYVDDATGSFDRARGPGPTGLDSR